MKERRDSEDRGNSLSHRQPYGKGSRRRKRGEKFHVNPERGQEDWQGGAIELQGIRESSPFKRRNLPLGNPLELGSRGPPLHLRNIP